MGGVTIPYDVAKLAEEAYDKSDVHVGQNQRRAVVKALARAILAERQRCADIAKKVAEEAYGDTSAIGAAAMIRGRILV
ncbi:hypothetical protein BTE77_06495 [Ensifer adhaerens]|nr:hypothetical protein BTE77_06495 [Ensifer adhaerens]